MSRGQRNWFLRAKQRGRITRGAKIEKTKKFKSLWCSIGNLLGQSRIFGLRFCDQSRVLGFGPLDPAGPRLRRGVEVVPGCVSLAPLLERDTVFVVGNLGEFADDFELQWRWQVNLFLSPLHSELDRIRKRVNGFRILFFFEPLCVVYELLVSP